MPKIKYVIQLSEAEHKQLKEVILKGKSPARTILRAHILLASDRNNKNYMTGDEIAAVYHTTRTTVQKVREEYTKLGLETTLNRKRRLRRRSPQRLLVKLKLVLSP